MTHQPPPSPAGPSPWRAEAAATVALALPLILTNLAQSAITTTEVVMLGRVGPAELAAGALGAMLFHGLALPAFGLAIAVSPLIAQARGRNRFVVRDIRRSVRAGAWAAATICLPIWLILWNAERLLLLAGQQPELAAGAGSYLRYLMWGALPFLLYATLRNFVAAFERPAMALAATAAAIVVNAVAGYALIFGAFGFPAMGLVGAGIAGSLASFTLFGVLLALILRDRRFRRYRLLGGFWRADWRRYGAIWRLGAPIGVTLAFEVFAFNAATLLMGLIGVAALAAHAVALQLATLPFMLPLGIAQAAPVRVGLAAGRGDRPGVARAGWTATALGVGAMTLCAAAFLLAPGILVGAFLDVSRPDAAEVAGVAAGFLAIAGLFQIVDGAQVVASGALRGLRDTRVPMVFAGIGYWALGLPVGAALAFPLGLGGSGIWIGLAAGLAAAAALLVGRFAQLSRSAGVPAEEPGPISVAGSIR